MLEPLLVLDEKRKPEMTGILLLEDAVSLRGRLAAAGRTAGRTACRIAGRTAGRSAGRTAGRTAGRIGGGSLFEEAYMSKPKAFLV